MLDMGADIVKVFPAGQLGPDYIKAIQAPLGKLPLMVVGGVNVANVQSYFDKGAMYAVSGQASSILRISLRAIKRSSPNRSAPRGEHHW